MWFSHSLDPKDSKKSKFDHLEGRLVVLLGFEVYEVSYANNA